MNIAEQNKQLLLEDLCTRLPYGVMIHYESGVSGDEMLASIDIEAYDIVINGSWSIKDVKPYLHPFDKLTWNDVDAIINITDCDRVGAKRIVYELQVNGMTDFELPYAKIQQLTDYLLSHHFDVHGLMEKGLALKATEGMYD